jgi:hypothetical protein
MFDEVKKVIDVKNVYSEKTKFNLIKNKSL